MVNRVWVTNGSFRISRPGYDVGYATPAQLAFDGFAGKYNGVYMSGVVANDASWTHIMSGNPFCGGNTFERYYRDIFFGKVFAQPPQVIYALQPQGNPGWGATPRYSYCGIIGADTGYSGLIVGAMTYTDRLRLYIDWPYANQAGVSSWMIAYVVFQT